MRARIIGIILWTLAAIALGLLAWNQFFPHLWTRLPRNLDEQRPSLEIVAR